MTEVKTTEPIIYDTTQTSYLHRDELRPSVRSYADNLYFQIQQEFKNQNINSLPEMEKAIKEDGMPITQIIKIQQLMNRLSNIATVGEIPKEEKDNIEQNIMENLEFVVNDWEKFLESDDFIDIRHKPFNSVEFLKPKIESLPVLPYDILINDQNFMQRVLSQIYNLMNKEGNQYSGLLASLILNKSLKGVSEEELSKVHQIFDITSSPYINYLGYEFPGGSIIIKGIAGNYTGLKMKGGKIYVEKTAGRAGAFMTGGELIIGDGGISTGVGMKGGKITIKKADDALGDGMENGTIEAEEARNFAGNGMKGGLIIIKSAASNLGAFMVGGTIKANKAGHYVGIDMTDGEIYVEKYKSIANTRNGGDIYIRGQKYQTTS